MARINVYSYPTDELDQAGTILDGWFDDDKATLIKEDATWNGDNHVSVHTCDQYAHQALYRTAGGRWVLNNYSQRQGSADLYEFLNDGAAREWLIRNNSDDEVAKYFGPLEDERGPGRPEVGPAINIRLGDLLPAVDERAKSEGVTRAEMIRRLIAASLNK